MQRTTLRVFVVWAVAVVLASESSPMMCLQEVNGVVRNVITLGPCGVGKSTICNRLVTPFGASSRVQLYRESDKIDPETLETKCCVAHWDSNAVRVCDHPGLQASGTVDEHFVADIVDHVKKLQTLDAVFLVFDMNSPRFVESDKAVLRLISAMIKGGSLWDNLALVFTKTYPSVFTDAQLRARHAEVETNVKKVIAEMGVKHDKSIPAFFVESTDMGDARTSQQLAALRQWVLNRTPLSTGTFEPPSAQFLLEETETREREIERRTEPIYASRQVWAGRWGKIFGKKKTITEQTGTRTTITMVKETRMKVTRYDATVSHTEWVVVDTWTTTA